MEVTSKRATASTTFGRVIGRTSSGGEIADFRGIPYAEPPIGRLRWQPPRHPEPWSYERACTSYSPIAYQKGGESLFASTLVEGLGLGRLRTRLMLAAVKWAPVKESEDCLTLNVRAPRDASGLPVMVWFHGGDHTDGAGSLAPYRGDALPVAGCVLVTVNYRLGLFGFYPHPDLDDRGEPTGNVGLLDQIASLEWVRDNIAQFGGDPGNVTIFGESAGGRAVLNLMCAPAARGLFHRAIAQSPGDSGMWVHRAMPYLHYEPAEVVARRFGEAAAGAGSGQLDRLLEMEAGDLMRVYRDSPDLAAHFYPTIGSPEIPRSPFAVFAEGAHADVPLLCGYNADEGSIFARYMHPVSSRFDPADISPEQISAALDTVHGEHADDIRDAYPGIVDGDIDAAAAHLGDRLFAVPVEYVTQAHARAGRPTYRYHFRATPPSPRQFIGAFHAAEVGPLFDVAVPLVDTGPGYEELSAAMIENWVHFATHGRPTDDWPRYSSDTPEQAVLDRATDGPALTTETAVPSAGVAAMTPTFREMVAGSA